MKDKARYYEIAASYMSDLLDLVNHEASRGLNRLISITRLTEHEFEKRLDDAEAERSRLRDIEESREQIFREAYGRPLSDEEWRKLEGHLPGEIDWSTVNANRIGPYVAILERLDKNEKLNNRYSKDGLNLDSCESKPFPDPNIDDAT